MQNWKMLCCTTFDLRLSGEISVNYKVKSMFIGVEWLMEVIILHIFFKVCVL